MSGAINAKGENRSIVRIIRVRKGKPIVRGRVQDGVGLVFTKKDFAIAFTRHTSNHVIIDTQRGVDI
jgi:hypothetical protein